VTRPPAGRRTGNLETLAFRGFRVGSLGFSWIGGLIFLGFPWILSLESRLINGLWAISREKYYLAPLPVSLLSFDLLK
jgi:hypothetical protein